MAKDSSGRITLRNMRRIARELGENLSDDELQAREAHPTACSGSRKGCILFEPTLLVTQAMLDEFDTDGDGEISMSEFKAIMKSTSLYDDD